METRVLSVEQDRQIALCSAMEKKNAHHSSVVVPEIMMEQLVSGGPDTVQAHPKIPVTATSNEKERERYRTGSGNMELWFAFPKEYCNLNTEIQV